MIDSGDVRKLYWVPEVYCVRFTQCFGSGGEVMTQLIKEVTLRGRYAWPEVMHCQAVGTIVGIINSAW